MKLFRRLTPVAIAAALLFSAVFVPCVAFAQEAAAAVTSQPDVKSALLTGFIQYVLPVVFTGLATLLGWVFVQLGKKWGTEAGTTKKNQVLGHVFALAQSVVADLEATLKPKLLEATADGVLTKAEITMLRTVALERLKALAGEKGLKEVQFVLGIAAPQLEQFLMGIIEKAVGQLPSGSTGSAPAQKPAIALAAAGNPT